MADDMTERERRSEAVPDGWRRLSANDALRDGDRYWSADRRRWDRTNWQGERIGRSCRVAYVRRKEAA